MNCDCCAEAIGEADAVDVFGAEFVLIWSEATDDSYCLWSWRI